MTAPVVALAGAIAVSQGQQQPLDPIASSMASYHLHASASVSATAEAVAASKAKLAEAAKGSTVGATSKQKQTAHPSSSPGSRRPASSTSPAAGGQPSPSSSPTPAATTTLTCTGTGGTGMLPFNYATIVNFLVAHGYTDMAAAGIAGNIYQESDGNPESIGSGGGGLIGWTPLPGGFVTGNVSADLQTQLAALLSYNQEWAQYIPMLNAATNPTDAADIYMNYFERPGLPAAANREGAADAVAQACGIAS